MADQESPETFKQKKDAWVPSSKDFCPRLSHHHLTPPIPSAPTHNNHHDLTPPAPHHQPTQLHLTTNSPHPHYFFFVTTFFSTPIFFVIHYFFCNPHYFLLSITIFLRLLGPPSLFFP